YDTSTLARLSIAARDGSPATALAYGKALEGTSLHGRLTAAQATAGHADARLWFQKAADRGNAEAWYWLGMTARANALADFVRAAELGYAPAFEKALDGTLFRAGENADGV